MNINKINRLKQKVEKLQSQIYHSPHFYQQWQVAKRALAKALQQNCGHQKKLTL